MVYTLPFCLISSILILIGIRKWREQKWGYCSSIVQLGGKVAVVTGANSGIGYEIAKELASRNARVILACRNLRSAEDAIKRMENSLKKPLQLCAMELDLGSLVSVKKFANSVQDQFPEIHLLINNAGVAYPNKQIHVTQDGFEEHFGVNHLGHFYLTELLLHTLTKSAPSRIVIVASSLHEKGKISFGDPKMIDLTLNTNLYANSKLANVYFSRELAKRTKEMGVNVYAVCPGWVYTGLFRHSIAWYHYILVAPIAFFFMRSPKQGAQTPIYCAIDPDLSHESGYLYRDCKGYESKVVFLEETSINLWEESEKLIKLKIK